MRVFFTLILLCSPKNCGGAYSRRHVLYNLKSTNSGVHKHVHHHQTKKCNALYIQDIQSEGHAASQLILQLHDKLVALDSLNDKQKSHVLEKLAVGCQLGYI